MTKVSSRGQVVIPREVRESLGLTTGTGLLVFKVGDSIILKSPNVTLGKELNLDAIREKIKRLKITRRDVEAEIRTVRMKRKKSKV